jgi:hypothetical protein
MQDFRIKLIKHLVRRLWSPIQVKQWSEHDSKKPNDQTVKEQNSKDLYKKCWSLRDKEPYPNRGATDANDSQAEEGKFQKTREASLTKEGMRWARMGPGWLAQPITWSIYHPLWPRQPSDIYSPHAKSHTSIHSSFATKEQEERGTIPDRGGSS